MVGDSLDPVVDAVRCTDGIEWVHVSNEEGGAFAAAAEAQVTGRLAACAGSCVLARLREGDGERLPAAVDHLEPTPDEAVLLRRPGD